MSAAPAIELNPLPFNTGAEDTETKNPKSAGTIKQLAQAYVALRDKKAEIEGRLKAELAPITERMAKVEAAFLKAMDELGVDSFKTDVGTPYKSVTRSFSVADGDAFNRFVMDQALRPLVPTDVEKRSKIVDHIMQSGALSFYEQRAAKSVVEQYLESEKELPPGLNTSSVVKANFRKS